MINLKKFLFVIAFFSSTAWAGSLDIYNSAGASGRLDIVAGTGGAAATSSVSPSSFTYTFNPDQARSTSTAFCAIENSSTTYTSMLLCDASVTEDAWWSTTLTNYIGNQLKADIFFTMRSATSGNVVNEVQIFCSTGGATTDVDAITLPTVNGSTIAVAGTAGYPTNTTITLTNQGGSCVQGSLMMIRFNRNGAHASDTASGDQEVRKVRIYE